jgi:hypothetical protein
MRNALDPDYRIPASYAADRAERVSVNLITGCWEWQGPVVDGVPYTHLPEGKAPSVKYRADRYFYNMAYGETGTGGKWSRRVCGCGICVKPNHVLP